MKINKAPGNLKVTDGISVCQIADEFQTPLGVIISAGEVLESYFERLTPERRRLALEDILGAARQMNHAVDWLIGLDKAPEKHQISRVPRQKAMQRRHSQNGQLRIPEMRCARETESPAL